MPSNPLSLLQEELLEGLDAQQRDALTACLESLDSRERDLVVSHPKLRKTLCGLGPPERVQALEFLRTQGALELFLPRGYPPEPLLPKVAAYLTSTSEPLALPRLVRKLRFYFIKYGPLHMQGFIERFDLDHLLRAFSTRVLHRMSLGEPLAFNIPLCIDPDASDAVWSGELRNRIRKCWLLSYIDLPRRARPSPEALELSSQFNRFTDLNYRALHTLNLHDKTVGDCLSCLDALEAMMRCYLELFSACNASAALEELSGCAVEAEITCGIREQIEASLRQELKLGPEAELPGRSDLPPQTEALLMAYDGEKANRLIGADLTRLEPLDRAGISAAEWINILHQKGLARGPGLFDILRLAGGRVITEISVAGEETQGKNGTGSSARRTNDFITFIDLRQSRRGGSIPFPVRVIVDSVTRNANIIPDSSRLKLVVYASEVETHLDIRIGGHSARVHYSLAPPERGGRFALLYAEGGNEEGNQRRLEVMARAFRKAGLKVTVNGQLLEAVYDKDCGATTLDAVREKTSLGLQILSSMPDLDYALAGFNGTTNDPRHVELFGFFDKPAVDRLLEAWAQHCFENGFFFLDLLRPAKKEEGQFYKRSELYWNGRGPYSDPYRSQMTRFAGPLEQALRESLLRTQLPVWSDLAQGALPLGQSFFDRLIDQENCGLRHSLLSLNERGFVRANPVIHELRQHPVTLFIDHLKEDRMLAVLSETADLARQVATLGSWEVLGKLGGLWVSRLRISVIKDVLSFFTLRVPESGEILLAFAAIGEDPLPVPFIDRIAERIRPSNIITETDWIALILNLFGYRVEVVSDRAPLDWAGVRRYLEQPAPQDLDSGAVSIPGVVTSPGIVTGRFRANVADRPLEDFRDGILVDQYLTPADDAKIQTARGVLITSGGELSHAAIRTREFQKPSLILKDVQYRQDSLKYTPHYNQCSMCCYPFVVREASIQACYCAPGNQNPVEVRDGDLVRLDAERGRLIVLGGESVLQQSFQRVLTLEQHPGARELWRQMEEHLAGLEDYGSFLFLLSEWVLVQDLPPERLEALLAAARANPRYGREVEEYQHHLLLDMARRTDALLKKQRVKIIRSDSLMELFYHLGAAAVRCERLENLERLASGGKAHDEGSRERLSRLRALAWGKIEQLRPLLLDGLIEAEERAARFEHLPESRELMAWKKLLRKARDAGLDWEPHARRLAERVAAFLELKGKGSGGRGGRPGGAGECWIPKTELDSDFRPLVGGKASHSGEILLALHELGEEAIGVPQGFATTIRLWDAWRSDPRMLKETHREPLWEVLRPYIQRRVEHFRRLLLDRRIEGLLEGPDGAVLLRCLAGEESLEPARVQRELERFASRLQEVEEIRADAVLRAFAQVLGRFAVRSSGIKEDSLEESFAGQKLTVLNVLGPLDLERAIGEVMESGAEAVLVEEMVPAEVSGVAFSVHPGTGDFGRILVNSAYGLGEGVVSGRVDPDTLILDKRTGRLLGQPVLGRKAIRIVPAAGTGDGGPTTRESPVPMELRRRVSLNGPQQLLLASAVRALEDHFDYPLDVEWAVDPMGRLFILQSRPITTLWRTLARGKATLLEEEKKLEGGRQKAESTGKETAEG